MFLTRTLRLHSQQAVLGPPLQQLQGQASSQWVFLGRLLKHLLSHVAAPTACTVVASVEAAEISMALAQTPAGAIAASPAAASLVPASAAAARTAGHGPVAVLPLFSGAQKRTASAIAQQVCTLKQWHQFMFAVAQLTWLHSCLCVFYSAL